MQNLAKGINLLLDIYALHKEVDPAHDINHVITVTQEVSKILLQSRYNFLTAIQRQALVIAALCHELDNVKLVIPSLSGSGKSNAQFLLEKYNLSSEEQELVLEIISLVSTRDDHNTTVETHRPRCGSELP